MTNVELKSSLQKAIDTVTCVEVKHKFEVRYLFGLGFYRYYLVMKQESESEIRCNIQTNIPQTRDPTILASLIFLKDVKDSILVFNSLKMTCTFKYDGDISFDSKENAIAVCNSILASKSMLNAFGYVLEHRKGRLGKPQLLWGEEITQDTLLLSQNIDLAQNAFDCIYHMYALCGGVISVDFIENFLDETPLSALTSNRVVDGLVDLRKKVFELYPEIENGPVASKMTVLDDVRLKLTKGIFPVAMCTQVLYEVMPDGGVNPMNLMADIIAEEIVTGLKQIPGRRTIRGATLYFLKNFVRGISQTTLDAITEEEMK